MNSHEKDVLKRMRKSGSGYGQIAAALGLSVNTVKSFCRREGLTYSETWHNCPTCGKTLPSTGSHQRKRFCSDTCRFAWSYQHRQLDGRNAILKKCACCSRNFYSYPSSHRKYCSHACYIADRYGKEADGYAMEES